MAHQTFPKPRPHKLTKLARAAAVETALRKMRKGTKARAGGMCEVCGKRGSETDHVQSRAQGGPHTVANGAYLCLTCHGFKTGNVIKLLGRSATGRLLWQRKS